MAITSPTPPTPPAGPAPVTTVAVVLAAGAGSRFTGDTHKLLAPLAGGAVLTHAVGHAVEADIGPVVVVTGAAPVTGVLPDGVVELHNPGWAAGQATSLAVAVDWAAARGHGAVVVGLGDQPGVPAAAWRAVAGAGDAPIAVATYAGRRGHPVRLARSVWGRLPRSGDEGARAVMVASPELVREVACEGDPGDVDTVEDLTRWR